jgi:hypothetical protein
MRLFTSVASADTEEVGENGMRRRNVSTPGGATVTVYLSIKVFSCVNTRENREETCKERLDFAVGFTKDDFLRKTILNWRQMIC